MLSVAYAAATCQPGSKTKGRQQHEVTEIRPVALHIRHVGDLQATQVTAFTVVEAPFRTFVASLLSIQVGVNILQTPIRKTTTTATATTTTTTTKPKTRKGQHSRHPF